MKQTSRKSTEGSRCHGEERRIPLYLSVYHFSSPVLITLSPLVVPPINSLRVSNSREQRARLCFTTGTDGDEAKRQFERGRTLREPEADRLSKIDLRRMEMYPTVRSRFEAASAYNF